MSGVRFRPGLARSRVTIQQQSKARDAAGQPVLAWKTVTAFWAQEQPTIGREFFAAASTNARLTTTFRSWWRDGIRPSMRLVCKGRVFNIVSVQAPEGIHAEMILVCEELVGEAP